MMTAAQRLRFSSLLSAGSAALVFRDALARVVAPRSEIARSRRAAAAFESGFLTQTMIPAQKQRIEGQVGLPELAPMALVLICHGIGERFYFWREVQHLLASAGVGSLVFHYPGYGRSTGWFTPESVQASAHAAYGYLQRLAPGVPMFLFGTSLGTAVAAHAAATLSPEPAGLIMAQGFTTLREAAGAVLRATRLPRVLRWLMPDAWRNTEALGATRCPVLIVHGASDELFAVTMGEALHRAAEMREGCWQALVTPAGYGHSDPMLGAAVGAYWEPILQFIRTEAGSQLG